MHDIVIDMHSTLDEKTVEAIVKQFVETKTGKAVSKIEISVKDNKFTGVSITYHSEKPTLNTEKAKQPVVIDRSFKPMIYD
jgi:predicted deacylase